MKHYKQPRTTGILRENHPIADTPPSTSSLKQRPSSNRKKKLLKENIPTSDLISPAPHKIVKSHLPPRPPSSNPLKRKLTMDTLHENDITPSIDSGVKVIVRMRPPNKHEEEVDMVVQKIACDSLSILGHTFTFDSVADANSSQLDMFELVGGPLVENCLAGFNSSVFAYGQTGSGKTYTIWGPANALLEENLSNDQLGLTPRVFQRLFSRINEEQNKHAHKHVRYQCRCSFLEIYNEQITDLLDPSQKNLQIREDVKTGVYVENLTEECVSTMEEVMQLLAKGLLNRRTGATSINVESSRSHSVFTCVVESRCKSATDGLSCFKTSRINLVDLAGSERQKLTGAAGERLKEAGNINRSLSQLGNLINILAEVSEKGKQRHIPYRDSKLTFLLQESLGGNSKLAVVCAVSPAESCKNDTLSTLRFAQRAKAIKNKAVVNEQVQDDVNVLREVIKQLKDELLVMKTNVNKTGLNGGGYSTGWNARRSLNLLKFSLNRPSNLPHVDEDGDEEMEIDETDLNENKQETSSVPVSEDRDVNMEGKNHKIGLLSGLSKDELTEKPLDDENSKSPIYKSLTPSVSPKVSTNSRKSLKTSSLLTASQKDLRTSKISFVATDVIGASLQCGDQLVENNRQRSSLRGSRFRFSYKPEECIKLLPSQVQKVDVGVQTLMQEDEGLPAEKGSIYLCNNCKNQNSLDLRDANEISNLQLVPVDGSPLTEKSKTRLPEAVEKVLAGAIRREMASEELCAKQNSEIIHLNRLVQLYKHEREWNAMIGQTREDKIVRLETLMDGVLSTEDFLEDELASLKIEHMLLKEKYDNHPEVLSTKIELKRAQDELERYQNFFDMGERDVLLEEIQDLRTQLQYYKDDSSSSHSGPETEHNKLDEMKTEVEKQKQELDREKKFSEELQAAMQTAMEGHTRMLEQYADLEEKHMDLLVRHRSIQDGIEDMKKPAAKAGVRGNETKVINALAAEISALKTEREKERRCFRDENKGLQAQLRDAAEAVEAAGELLVRLKEAEEAIATAQKRAADAEKETEKAYEEINKLKKKKVNEIDEEDDLSKLLDPSSWFSGYDRCNI